MSNRQRASLVSPETRRAIRNTVRCPDCDSQVTVRGGTANVAHDGCCPSLAQLERQRRTLQAVLVLTPDTDVVGLLDGVQAISERHGQQMRITTSPYTALHHDNGEESR